MIDADKYVKTFKMKNPYTHKEMIMTCEYKEYAAGGIALQLYTEDEDGFREPYCMASTCVANALEDEEIAIKDYGTNTGIFEALLKGGVINEPHRYISSGFVARIPVCTLKEVEE